MHVIIGDQKVDLTEGSNGRLQATFTAAENTDSVLIPSDCIGTLNVNDIQLEQGTQATPFVEPSVQSEDMSGIFKDLHELRIDIKDTEEGLSHKITVNQEGLEQLISDTEERLNSRITLTADTWQGELSDTEEGLSNQITSTANFWQRKLTDTERGLRNVIQSKADSLVALVEDTEKGLNHQIVVNQEGLEQLISNTEDRLDSRITLMADTWQGELDDAKRGLNNQITATASLWQTKLSDTERELRSVIQSRADSLITLIEDTDSANFTKTEQLVNGLQSTVQGDLRSQRVQLENLISSRIESATGERSTIWQTLNSHGSQISNAQGDISKVEQTISGYSRRISNVEGKYSSIEQTVSGLNTEVNGYNGLKSRTRQLEGLIDQRVTRSDVEGIIRNSGDSIWLAIGNRVQETADNATMTGDEIISEINLSRSGARISGENIFLDSNVTWTRDFRTRFASVIELRADQITSGTIDASRIRVINLDANSITGNTTNFIKSNWNNISTQISIDDRGINVTGNDMWRRTYFNQTGFELFNGSGADRKAGAIGFFKGSAYNVTDLENGFLETRAGITRHALGIGVTKRTDLMLGVQSGSANNMFRPSIEIRGDTGDILIHNDLVAGDRGQGIKLITQSHRGDYGITIQNKETFRARLHLSTETYLEAPEGITFHARYGTRNFRMHNNNDSYRNLSMQGNEIINQSDRRLKTNIRETQVDSLKAIKSIKFVEFTRINNGKFNDIGVIAQDTPSLATYSREEDTWHINNSKQIMMNSHAIQQLSIQTEHQFSTHEKQIFELQQELSKANRRIKELEELIA